MKELEDGYAYRFPASGDWLTELAKLVDLERQCCQFMRFRITVEPGNASIWLEMSGQEGTKGFVAATFTP